MTSRPVAQQSSPGIFSHVSICALPATSVLSEWPSSATSGFSFSPVTKICPSMMKFRRVVTSTASGRHFSAARLPSSCPSSDQQQIFYVPFFSLLSPSSLLFQVLVTPKFSGRRFVSSSLLELPYFRVPPSSAAVRTVHPRLKGSRKTPLCLSCQAWTQMMMTMMMVVACGSVEACRVSSMDAVVPSSAAVYRVYRHFEYYVHSLYSAKVCGDSCALILSAQTLALYKLFTYLLTVHSSRSAINFLNKRVSE